MLRGIILLPAILLAAAPTAAANYSATLSRPLNSRLIAPDISWHCSGAACQGSTDDSRPVVLCESLARRAGPVESFLVDGRAFTAADLKRCNASLKEKRGQDLAAER